MKDHHDAAEHHPRKSTSAVLGAEEGERCADHADDRLLDPIDHDVEITHLSMDVLIPPLFAYMAYTSGFARTLGNPAVANRIWREGAGDQIRTPVRRDRDTLTFFGEFMRRGHRSPQAQAVFDRVQDIHRQVKGVGNETQVHVLGMLIFDPERFAKAVGHRWFTDKENDARFNFWLGVARGMRLRDVLKPAPSSSTGSTITNVAPSPRRSPPPRVSRDSFAASVHMSRDRCGRRSGIWSSTPSNRKYGTCSG